MRITLAAHCSCRVGGVEQYLATLVPSLLAAGHDVSCWFETAAGEHEPILAADAPVEAIVASEHRDPFGAARAWRPDVIFAHGLSDAAHERALLDVAPGVIFAHDYHGTCISGTKTIRAPRARCCERTFGPSCLVQYYPRHCGGWSPVTMVQLYGLQRARLGLLASYERIAVASRHMAEEYARHGFASKVRVVGLPIESPVAPAARDDGDGAWRLLYLGRLEFAKGADLALESAVRTAALMMRPVHLQISGAGSLDATLRARADHLTRVEPRLSVTFTGWLDQRKAAAAVDHSDLLLVPSRWPEPFGMVGVEAALRGVPSVAFAVGGIREWLIDDVTGRLVDADPPCVDAYAAAIAACLIDRRWLARVRQHCRESATRFQISSHLAALEPVLAESAYARLARTVA